MIIIAAFGFALMLAKMARDNFLTAFVTLCHVIRESISGREENGTGSTFVPSL